VVSYGEEAAGGREALFGCEREREVWARSWVGPFVGGVAPAHLPLHQLLRSPHRRGLLRRRHFYLWSFFGSWGPECRARQSYLGSGHVLGLVLHCESTEPWTVNKNTEVELYGPEKELLGRVKYAAMLKFF